MMAPTSKGLYEAFARAQLRMSELVVYDRDLVSLDSIRLAAGMDVGYSKRYGGLGVVVLIDTATMRVVDYSVAVGEPSAPYVPGFLAFREAPLLYTAYQELSREPDIIVVDGHGISHPRFMGIASHIGLALGKPSIGVAKKKLAGTILEENGRRVVVHRGVVVAEILGEGRRRLYVSPGHGITLATAVAIVKRLILPGRKLPEPTHQADALSKHIARRLDQGQLSPAELRKRRRLTDYI